VAAASARTRGAAPSECPTSPLLRRSSGAWRHQRPGTASARHVLARSRPGTGLTRLSGAPCPAARTLPGTPPRPRPAPTQAAAWRALPLQCRPHGTRWVRHRGSARGWYAPALCRSGTRQRHRSVTPKRNTLSCTTSLAVWRAHEARRRHRPRCGRRRRAPATPTPLVAGLPPSHAPLRARQGLLQGRRPPPAGPTSAAGPRAAADRRARRAAERVDHGRRSASPSWCVGDLPERQKGDGGGISGAGGRGREGRASGLRSDGEGAHTAPNGRLTSWYRVVNGPTAHGCRGSKLAPLARPPARRSCEAGRQSGAASRALAWAANKAPHSRAPGLNVDGLEVSDSSAVWANAVVVVVSCARCGEARGMQRPLSGPS